MALVIVIVEYMARLYVPHWFPALGSYQVNAAISSCVFYGLLVLVTAPRDRLNPGVFEQTLRQIATYARTNQWLWVGLALAAARISIIDEWFWGHIHLSFPEAPLNPVVLFPEASFVLAIVGLFVSHGFVVPIAEEWLWRRLIQPRFVGVLGFVPGLLLTAVLFSLKHAIVDASLGRLLALVVVGILFGYVAKRWSWKASAFVHVAANIIGAIVCCSQQAVTSSEACLLDGMCRKLFSYPD